MACMLLTDADNGLRSGVMSVGLLASRVSLSIIDARDGHVGTEALLATQYSLGLKIDMARAIRRGPYSSEARQPRRRGSRRAESFG
jgi:hypothetical protein